MITLDGVQHILQMSDFCAKRYLDRCVFEHECELQALAASRHVEDLLDERNTRLPRECGLGI